MPTARIINVFMAAAVAASVNLASAQNFPSKLIRIVTNGAGTSFDITSRIIAQGITAPLGQSVIVDNRANGVIASELVTNAPPDGHTLLVSGGILWIFPILQGKTYDPLKEFASVTLAALSPLLLVVHPSLPVKSVRELIAIAKAHPGQLNYASGATGSVNHLAGELFRTMSHVNIVRIGYKNATPALNDLIAGEVQFMFPVTGVVAQHLKTGRLRSVAVTSAERSALAPGLPTISESGLPGYESVSITAVLAPAKTPEAVIGRLNQEIVKVLTRPEVKQNFFNTGVESVGSTPQQLTQAMIKDMATMTKLVKDANIHVD